MNMKFNSYCFAIATTVLALLTPTLAHSTPVGNTPTWATLWDYYDFNTDPTNTANPETDLLAASLNQNGDYTNPVANFGTGTSGLIGITGSSDFQATAHGNLVQETTGTTFAALGLIDMHYEYADSVALGAGVVKLANFNIYGLRESGLSDTLSITFTGHTTDAAGFNTSVDLHFRSSSLEDTVLPEALVNGNNIFESYDPSNPYVDVSSLITQATGLNDAHVRFASVSVPEPMTLIMLGMGLIGFGYSRRYVSSDVKGLSA